MANIIEKTLRSLKQRKINGYCVSSKEELFSLLKLLIPEKSKVGCGDSLTLDELGVFDYLRREYVVFMINTPIIYHMKINEKFI